MKSTQKLKLMGILNVTPDSFSDGGLFLRPESALEHAYELIDDGADIIDIGGESTRPGSEKVSAEVELNRILPVIRRLSETSNVLISVDTMKSEVAEKCIDAGANIINDVYGLRGEGMLQVVADNDVSTVIMHMYGNPDNMHDVSMQGDVISQINEFFEERLIKTDDAKISRDKIILDPGMGFGKTPEQNIEILNNSSEFSKGCKVLMASSRKRFLSTLYPNIDKNEASIEAAMVSIKSGADIVRIHDVKALKSALYKNR